MFRLMGSTDIYKPRRTSSGLVIDIRNPATGKEKRIECGSRPPRVSFGAKFLSPHAELLRDARQGDRGAEDRLLDHLEASIRETAKQEQWRLEGRYRMIAELALRPFIYQDQMSLRKAAHFCGVRHTPFQRNWVPKIRRIQYDLKKRFEELNKN